MDATIKIPRAELIAGMRERDGDICMHPDCGKSLDFNLIGSEQKNEPTIDHWYPQVWCRDNGWTFEQIWDISNLKLMHKACNARKGQLVPFEDGTLPEKKVKRFKFRRDRRADRPTLCTMCNNGRYLEVDQICGECGRGPDFPFPTLYQVSPNDCPHEGPWNCFMCVAGAGMIIRQPAIVDVLDGDSEPERIFEYEDEDFIDESEMIHEPVQ